MHKSLGNGVDPDDMVRKYGADIVRLWAASSDYHADVRCSDAIFRQLSETYRKIRNTARILLANRVISTRIPMRCRRSACTRSTSGFCPA